MHENQASENQTREWDAGMSEDDNIRRGKLLRAWARDPRYAIAGWAG